MLDQNEEGQLADVADVAGRVADLMLQADLAQARQCKPVAEATGFCLNCTEPLPDGVRWCDSDCQLDWEKRMKQ